MSLSSRVLMSFLAAALGAVAAWLVVDFSGLYHMSAVTSVNSFHDQAFVGATFGFFVGLGLGIVNGISGGTGAKLRREIAGGMGVGILGGLLGLLFGQAIFGALYVDPTAGGVMGPLVFALDVLVRAIGWGLMGLFIGLVQGIPSKSAKAAKHGALGGFIGGVIGGTFFEMLPNIVGRISTDPDTAGIVSRGVAMSVTGAAIGLFVGLAETLLKQAWVRVVKGRNEGKEYIISKPQTTIGRDELADISLFGDAAVAVMHATIVSDGSRHSIVDGGSPAGVSVNGQRTQKQFLRDGDRIGVGGFNLEFHERATASIAPPKLDAPPAGPARIPTAGNICPFCGAMKHPVTGECACSLASSPQSSSPDPFGPQSAAPSWGESAAGPGPARLVGIAGPHAAESFPVSASGETSIGREPGMDVLLSGDSTVSRRHARIVREGAGYAVYDDGSSNGTSVNGRRVTRQDLASGDEVSFGSSVFRFEA